MASSDSSLTNEVEDEARAPERDSRSSVASQQNAAASVNDSLSVFDSRKDDRYWERRRKNNEAAKRSREKRRMNDIVMEKRIVELNSDNTRLRTEIERLHRLYKFSDTDLRAALGASANPESDNQPAANRKRRSTNGEFKSNLSNGCNRRTRDAVSNSDASSASSLDHHSFTPRSLSGDARNHATANSPAKRRANVESLEVHAHLNSNQQTAVTPNVKLECAEPAANGVVSVPDLVNMLGVLQNIPLLQALLKGGAQPQPAPQPSNALPVLQQLALLQQLCGLNAPVSSSSPSSNPVSLMQQPPAPTPTPSSNTAALDLRCKPSTSDVTLAVENRTLRVELDRINVQMRELKDILLQRAAPLSATAVSKRLPHSTSADVRVTVADASDDDADDGELAVYSKRGKHNTVYDASLAD